MKSIFILNLKEIKITPFLDIKTAPSIEKYQQVLIPAIGN
jgi:hypothetical protein